MRKKEIVRFYMGRRFDNRQVNNFLINQEVMSTWKTKLLLFIKIRSITIRQLQLNYCPIKIFSITIRSTLNLHQQF